MQPRVSGQFTGTLNGEDAEASRSGIADTKLKFTDEPHRRPGARHWRNSRGASRRRRWARASRFRRRPATTTRDKLINVGTNRWALKPEIGLSHPVGRWTLEAIAGAWFFEDNDDFFGGRHREQEPLASVQAHVSYTFRPRLWLAFNATYYDGGRSTVDGDVKDDRQSNSRYGLTLSVPVARSQSLKLNWNDGASTRIGSDFSTWGIAWQYTLVN